MYKESTYRNAFSEVHEILGKLDKETLNKIPESIIQTIKNNRNIDYQYIYEENNMMQETKAVLFNIFRDYMATPSQKQKIIRFQNSERNKQNLIKEKMYNSNEIFKNRK